jgi:hypothetical protein
MPRKYWTIVREHRFERELRALIRDAIRADEFVEGAEFVLARDPRKGVEVPRTPIWYMPMALIGEYQITLYYTFNETTVWLLSIRKGS